MKREEKTLWNIFFIIFLLSYVVTAIVTFQEDENDPVVQSTNRTVLENPEENISFKDNLTLDIIESNRENVDINSKQKVDEEISDQPIFADFTSQNSGILNDVTTSGTPLVVSIPEDANTELKAKVEELSASVVASQLESHINQTKDTPLPAEDDPSTLDEEPAKLEEPKNDIDVPLNTTSDAQEDIPSFSEWAQKRMEEAVKNGEVQNDSTHHQAASNGKSGSGVKLGWKNYAAPDCGAKVVAANPEAVSPKSVISPSREEYKLNVCTDRIWFIVELCEAIQAKKIDIANFELFSSTPKDFVVSIGDRFPNREWSTVGQFTAQDVRDIQSFDLNPHLFGRYIKVEVKSHHGSQHFCPISLFRVYGTSELEVLQKEELADDDDDEDDNETLDAFPDDQPKNMLNSATNAVFSMIKKAAEVLGTKSNDTVKKNEEAIRKPQYTPLINTCSTPSHRIVCTNCSDVLFGQIYELLSCKSAQLHNLVGVPYIRRSLIHSNICHTYGLNFNENDHHSTFNRSSRSVQSFFSNKILGAMCNILSVSENKAVLNISLQFSNKTNALDLSEENLAHIETPKATLKVEHSIDAPVRESFKEVRPTEELDIVMTNNVNIPKSTCSTDVAYTSQIKPTKTVTLDLLVDSSEVPVDSETEELPVRGSKTDVPPGEADVENDNEKLEQFEAKTNETQQTVEVQTNEEISTESSENMDQIENFMVDLNGENGASTAPSVSASSSHDRQKESVFLRLSNRIKVLERNVSLSSQYLEELSRRYKKQVEEMQKLLDKTLQSVTEERKRMAERNQQLEERLDQLMAMISKWPTILFWFLLTVAISCGMLVLCRSERTTSMVESSENMKRRKSVDIIRTTVKKTKIRRPSDQALKIVRSSVLPEERKLSKEKRKRKKSNKGIKRSNSATGLESDGSKTLTVGKTSLSTSKCTSPRSTPERVQNSLSGDQQYSSYNTSDWVEENRRLLEVTLLDESEHSSLEPISTFMELDVPQYSKTATDTRAHRMSSQFNKSSVNGDSSHRANIPRKTGSLDESYSFRNSIDRRSSLNSKSEEGTRKKEKKSFRSVLKNVFT